jgi:hypothetical protein
VSGAAALKKMPIKVTVPSKQSDYIVRLMAIADSTSKSNSNWGAGTGAAIFPKVSFSAKKGSTTKTYKIVNVTAKATWKQVSYGHYYKWVAKDSKTNAVLGSGTAAGVESFPVTVYTSKQFYAEVTPVITGGSSSISGITWKSGKF